MNGEIAHSERGPLVQQFNAATTPANGFMYVVAAIMAACLVVVLIFTYRKPHD